MVQNETLRVRTVVEDDAIALRPFASPGIYNAVFTGVFALAYAACSRSLRARLPWLAAAALAASLIAMPAACALRAACT